MSIEDPTISTLASYGLNGQEAFVGLLTLMVTIIVEMVKKLQPQDTSRISYEVTRTPEENFKGAFLFLLFFG